MPKPPLAFAFEGRKGALWRKNGDRCCDIFDKKTQIPHKKKLDLGFPCA